MSAKIDYSDIVGGFQIMAERIAAFESLSARLLSSESVLANNRRDLKDRLLTWLLETSDVIPWKPDPRF